MKILLIEPLTSYIKETTLENFYSYPHLGLLSIAANLEKDGHGIDYFSTNIYKNPIFELKRLLNNNYDFVGISTLSNTIDYELGLGSVIKQFSPKTKVVCGGIHAWLNPEEILNNKNVDFVIRGHGEIPFKLLVNGKKPSKVPGLCYRNQSRKVIKNVFLPSKIDFQKTISLLDYSKYEEIYKRTYSFRNTRHLFTSFGCPFNCNFCSVPNLYLRKILFRDIENVIEEVKRLSKITSRITFVDPDININKEHFIKLFSRIIEEKQKGAIKRQTVFVIQARLDCFDKEMLKITKKVNVIALIGLESISQNIRDKDLNKGGRMANMSSEEVIKKIEEIKKYLRPYLYFILATPETTKKDLMENLKYIKGLTKGWYEINRWITPFSNTSYFNMYKDTNNMIWQEIKMEFGTIKIPDFIKCKDEEVAQVISTASDKAREVIMKNINLSFTSIFLKELMKELLI